MKTILILSAVLFTNFIAIGQNGKQIYTDKTIKRNKQKADLKELLLTCSFFNELPLERALIKSFAFEYLENSEYLLSYKCVELLKKFPLKNNGWCGTPAFNDHIAIDKLRTQSLIGLQNYSALDEIFIPLILNMCTSASGTYLKDYNFRQYSKKPYSDEEICSILSEARKNIEVDYQTIPIKDSKIYLFELVLKVDDYLYENKDFGCTSIPDNIDPMMRNILLQKEIVRLKNQVKNLLNCNN